MKTADKAFGAAKNKKEGRVDGPMVTRRGQSKVKMIWEYGGALLEITEIQGQTVLWVTKPLFFKAMSSSTSTAVWLLETRLLVCFCFEGLQRSGSCSGLGLFGNT